MTIEEMNELSLNLNDFVSKVLIPTKTVKSVERPLFLDEFEQNVAKAVDSHLNLK